MAVIIVYKRTRATAADEWSLWHNIDVAVDTSPYTSTDILEYRSNMSSVDFEDFTDNVVTSTDGAFTVTGDGVFDNMMEAVSAHIDAQYKLSRITGADYATVYLGAMQSAMQTSMQFVLGKTQAERQAELVARQTQGFDDDAKQKALKQLMDTWSVAYSVSQSGVIIPDAIHPDTLDTIVHSMVTSLGVIDDTAQTANAIVKIPGNSLGIT